MNEHVRAVNELLCITTACVYVCRKKWNVKWVNKNLLSVWFQGFIRTREHYTDWQKKNKKKYRNKGIAGWFIFSKPTNLNSETCDLPPASTFLCRLCIFSLFLCGCLFHIPKIWKWDQVQIPCRQEDETECILLSVYVLALRDLVRLYLLSCPMHAGMAPNCTILTDTESRGMDD